MAHLESYTRQSMTKITREAYRVYDDQKKYKNEVDLNKTKENYSMNGLTRQECLKAIDMRCMEIMQGRKMQKGTNVVGSWIFTVPEKLRGQRAKEDRYFEVCKKFLEDRYGKENVIDLVVHRDETTPHATAYVVPEATSRKTGKKTISSASCFTRGDLKGFHNALDKALEQEFGIKGLALNGRTQGDYSLEELKQRTKDEKEMRAKREKLNAQEEDLLHIDKITNGLYEYNEKQKKKLDEKEEQLQAESERLQAEYERRTADAIAQSEAALRAAQNEHIAAQRERKAAEQERKQAEQERKQAAAERKSAEQFRAAAIQRFKDILDPYGVQKGVQEAVQRAKMKSSVSIKELSDTLRHITTYQEHNDMRETERTTIDHDYP